MGKALPGPSPRFSRPWRPKTEAANPRASGEPFTFERFARLTHGHSGPGRLALFEALPEGVQDAAWADLAERERHHREANR